ncbi:LytR C-terminal domain-containing protein [Streptomyces sp. DSM 42041]|uniref:LytR C-terminal domain-containing protein n=1 Tax=Streptomyces hazeniae TaxID=3075538 RepID=A0ABU2NW05_9ACTN|nr:LytR C-terminal domain-containing protein [Streptomyces sp. DSM 42041]MDT0380177.1 LytR C-terminal domain-containing protein [Streptomyces sp. DSM 42041]
MSMLTPPGMGGQYRIKGDRYPRMRRPRNRRKIVLAGVATAMTLGLVGWGSLQIVGVFAGNGDSAQAAGRTGDQCRAQDGTSSADGRNAEQASASARPGAQRNGKAGEAKAPTAVPKPGKVTVNVLNATSRSGLAAKTAKELKKRGFAVGEIANAPAHLDHKVDAPGLLIGAAGTETLARMKVLGTQLEDAKTRHDAREGDDVDLVIGNDFKGLAKEKDADRALTALAQPSPKPSPSC